MKRFIVLQSNQRFIGLLGMYDERRITSIKECYNLIPLNFILINTAMDVILCMVNTYHVLFSGSHDLSKQLSNAMLCLLMIQASGVFHDIRLKMEKIAAFHNKLQSIVNKGFNYFKYFSFDLNNFFFFKYRSELTNKQMNEFVVQIKKKKNLKYSDSSLFSIHERFNVSILYDIVRIF